ncbi:MAG: hypothetical protein Q9188_002344 [Gyalolechia gomerana]
MATDDLDVLTATFRGDFVGTFFQSSYHSNGATGNSPYRVDDLHCTRPKIAILFGYDGDWLEIAAATRRHGWIAAAWRSKVRELEFCLIIIELIRCVQVAHLLFPDFSSRIQQA